MVLPRPFLFLMAVGMFAPVLARASSDEVKAPVVVQDVSTDSSQPWTVYVANLAADASGQSSAATTKLNKMLMQQTAKALMPRSQCFTMRSYKFKRDDSAQDELQPSGQSTCEAATLFSLKDASLLK